MSDDWLLGDSTDINRILDAVNGDKRLAGKIQNALRHKKVDRVLSKVDSNGNVETIRLDVNGNKLGDWP